MEEGIHIIRQAWGGVPVRIEGRRYQIDSLTVAPAPEQPPKLYMGGMAPAGHRPGGPPWRRLPFHWRHWPRPLRPSA